MEHLDEGTAHAWLDGALPAHEAAQVEAHIASCPDCAAIVAEARGLIAGASRILGALDDVPGDVIPEVSPPVAGEPVVPLRRPAPAPAAPRWRVSAGMRAAAAAIFVVGAGTLVLRSTASRDRAPAADTVAVAASTASAAPVVDSASAAPGTSSAAPVPAPVPAPMAPPMAPAAAPPPQIAMSGRRAAPERERPANEAAAPSMTAALSPAPMPAPGVAGAAASAPVDRARPLADVAASPLAAPLAAPPGQSGAAPAVAQTRTTLAFARPLDSAGLLADADAAATEAVRLAADRVAAVAGCYSIVDAAPGLPDRLELQPAALPPAERRRGFALRLPAGAATPAYWTPLANDSVRVVWTVPDGGVDLRMAHEAGGVLRGVARAFTNPGGRAAAAPDGGTPRAVVARRVPCTPPR